MSIRPLHAAPWPFLRAATALALALASGCADGPTDPLPVEELAESVCAGDGIFVLGADPTAVHPGVPVDWMEFRYYDAPGGSAFSVIGATGTPCAGASDRDRCAAALAALPHTPRMGPTSRMPRTPDDLLVAYTRGDEVGALRTPDALTVFLGAVDTRDEAAWLGSGWGLGAVPCARSVARRADGAWDVNVRVVGHCGGLFLERRVVRIDGASYFGPGRTTIVPSTTPGPCY